MASVQNWITTSEPIASTKTYSAAYTQTASVTVRTTQKAAPSAAQPRALTALSRPRGKRSAIRAYDQETSTMAIELQMYIPASPRAGRFER